MSALPYLPWFVGDYFADTLHLTRDQHGGYLLLLATLWNSGGSLPNDPAILAQVTKATPKEWEKLAPVLMPFFLVKDGRISSKRLTKELSRTNKVREARREASQQAAIARAMKKVGRGRPHRPFGVSNDISNGAPNGGSNEEPNGPSNGHQTDIHLNGISRKEILTTVESLPREEKVGKEAEPVQPSEPIPIAEARKRRLDDALARHRAARKFA